MTDDDLIYAECQRAQSECREISDACARMIAAQHQSDNVGASFASTGAITGDVFCALFYVNGRAMYPAMSRREKLAADAMGTYLTNAPGAVWSEEFRVKVRGPVEGWSSLWLAA